MRLFHKQNLLISSMLCMCYLVTNAQNPIIQTNYTADPAPLVYNDKVYI